MKSQKMIQYSGRISSTLWSPAFIFLLSSYFYKQTFLMICSKNLKIQLFHTGLLRHLSLTENNFRLLLRMYLCKTLLDLSIRMKRLFMCMNLRYGKFTSLLNVLIKIQGLLLCTDSHFLSQSIEPYTSICSYFLIL